MLVAAPLLLLLSFLLSNLAGLAAAASQFPDPDPDPDPDSSSSSLESSNNEVSNEISNKIPNVQNAYSDGDLRISWMTAYSSVLRENEQIYFIVDRYGRQQQQQQQQQQYNEQQSGTLQNRFYCHAHNKRWTMWLESFESTCFQLIDEPALTGPPPAEVNFKFYQFERLMLDPSVRMSEASDTLYFRMGSFISALAFGMQFSISGGNYLWSDTMRFEGYHWNSAHRSRFESEAFWEPPEEERRLIKWTRETDRETDQDS